MLDISFIMNSAVEEIFSFKTCCGLMRVFDQNLEIHIRNKGPRPITVPSCFDLEGEYGSKKVETLTPPGIHRIIPGQIIAFYCTMDETLWEKSQKAIFYDGHGKSYPVVIIH